jgi:hypothetical protein
MRAWGLVVLATCLSGPVLASMSDAPGVKAGAASEPLPRAAQRRFELWQQPAGAQLRARYRLTRVSSLLYEPRVVQGELVFAGPDRLELRDDEADGATTTIAAGTLTIAAKDARLPGRAAPGSAAGRWLQGRLLALFAAEDGEALRLDARVRVLRGGVLELTPTPGHPARRVVRELRVALHPASGEVVELVIVEASGDVVTLALSEHRR